MQAPHSCLTYVITLGAAPLRSCGDNDAFSSPLLQAEDGPVDAPKTVADVRQEPYNLPPGCANACAAACGQTLHLWSNTAGCVAKQRSSELPCRHSPLVCWLCSQTAQQQVSLRGDSVVPGPGH